MTETGFASPTLFQDLGQFRQLLAQIAGYSTVGVTTLSGVSPKGAALGDLAVKIAVLPDSASQLAALDAVLAESHTLWADQEAHVIANILRALIEAEALVLHPDAGAPAVERILRAAIRVAPHLQADGTVSDSLAFEVLNSFVSLIQLQGNFKIAFGTREDLEAAGFHPPGSPPLAPEDPHARAARDLAEQLHPYSALQLDAPALRALLAETIALPPPLRARILTVLVNLTWNILRDPDNHTLIAEIQDRVLQLPPQHRLTPLEAYYNQINLLPAETARPFGPFLLHAIGDLPPTTDDPRFIRARNDLAAMIDRQQGLLSRLSFQPNESLADRYHRDPAGF